MFCIKEGLFFARRDAGSVELIVTDGNDPMEGGKVLYNTVIDNGSWTSLVLTMSLFGERPGDWHKWIDHHDGRKDLLT